MASTRLSLVAEFDDLVRNRAVLTSSVEQEFMKFVMNQEVCRRQWQEAETLGRDYSKRIKALQQENEALNTKLKHARTQIDHEMTKRRRIEQERDEYERQIMVVRELLNDKNRTALDDKDRERLAFLSTECVNSQYLSPRCNLTTIDESGSILSPDDISYDRTEDDLDGTRAGNGRGAKRQTYDEEVDDRSDVIPSGKRTKREKKKHRRSNSTGVLPTTPASAAAASAGQTDSDLENRQRRFSTPGPLHVVDSNGDLRQIDEDNRLRSNRRKDSAATMGSQQSIDVGLKRCASGNSLSKLHTFVFKNFYKQDLCAACGKKPRFSTKVAKCKDCRLIAHQECKDLLPLPCVPTQVTPLKNSAVGFLSDYVSSEPPMIPALVIRCVEEVNLRGLKEEGIYRVPGNDKEVKELKERFMKGKILPNLASISDINVVCGCLKDFLRGLKEPIVTYRLWNTFASAVANPDENESASVLYQAISELPQPNRDTLAYLILHLQRIASTPACKMTPDNLATCFGPTIIGYSQAEPSMNQIMMQTKTQQNVIKKLMAISSDYWMRFTKIDTDFDSRARDFSTPNTNCRYLPKYGYDAGSAFKDSAGHADVEFERTATRSIKRTQPFFDSPDLK